MTILGIDPGTATTGYGVVLKDHGNVHALAYGAIRTSARREPPERLRQIYERVSELLVQFSIEQLATERLFFARNETTAFGVGRTIGVVLLAAAQRGIPWTEYTPMQVKQAVVGYGGASKQQVQFMIQRILGLDVVPRPDDAADALAVAVCHAHTTRSEP